MKSIISYTVRKTTDEEKAANMPYLTSSMVDAIVTCPKWGIIHNVQGRRFVTGYRQMALEAGSLMHDVFATFNLYAVAKQGSPLHALYHGKRLFGDRWDAIKFKEILELELRDHLALEKLAYRVIASSDYYDDPEDKNRTLANLEHCAIELAGAYCRSHIAWPIYISDPDDMAAPIGIELSLDVVFECLMSDETITLVRIIGLVDCLYQNPNTKVVKGGEYKTTSSMNEGWRESFKTRHQQSFYWGGLNAYFDNVSEDFILTGSTIPVRKTVQAVMDFPILRTHEHVLNALTAALAAKQYVDRYKDDAAITAPMFTHSCNRYFRPCSFIDLCNSDRMDQYAMWNGMEVVPYPSPSEMKALLRQGE